MQGSKPYLLAALLAGAVAPGASVAIADDAGTSTLRRFAEVPPTVGQQRTYRLHLPPPPAGTTNRRKPVPLVVVLHGAFSTAAKIERLSGWSELADAEGFAVAYPNGSGLGPLFRHWNSGHCCGKALRREFDDVGFVADLIDHLVAEEELDGDRVYLVGHSNGGMLVHRFAAERAESIAAAAVVAGTIGGRPGEGQPVWTPPPPSQPVPMLLVHGRVDGAIPFEGKPEARGGGSILGVEESAAFWREANDSVDEALVESLYQAAVERRSWAPRTRAGAAVVVLALAEGPHRWPGHRAHRRLDADDPLRPFDAATEIWRFFVEHGAGTAR